MRAARETVRSRLFGARRRGDASIGRYVLRQQIGQGGFGAVFRAYDPKLQRDVALKLIPLPPDAADDDALAEARITARLRHPALVAVHDVGTCDASAILGPAATHCAYMVLELLSGTTLRAWKARAERSVRDILGVIVRAGEGVAAAHARGVTHLDLKPENIVVDDERVIVLDFGLAKLSGRGEADTATESLAGTPGYMAPEQWLDGTSTPATDQFALAVCAYELLFDRRPSRSEIGTAGRIAVPHRLGLTGKQRRALARALSADPRHRFGSMRAFIDALWPRRRWLTASGVLVPAAAVVLVAALDHDPCDRFADRAATLWSHEIRDQVVDRLPASHSGAAELIDQRIAAWSDASTTACRSEAEGTGLVAVEQSACFEDYGERVSAVIDLLRAGAPAVIDHLPRVVARLDGLETCEPTPDWLLERSAEGFAIEALLERVDTELDAGHLQLARDLAQTALDRAQIIGASELESLAHQSLCTTYTGDIEAGWKACEAALVAAERSNDRRRSVEALLQLARLRRRADPSGAARYLELARAKLGPHDSDPWLRARFELARAEVVDLPAGRHAVALERLLEARRELERTEGEPSYRVATLTSSIGLTLRAMGRNDEARVEHERFLALGIQLYGDGHPWVAAAHHNIGDACLAARDWTCAMHAFGRALAIKEHNEGDASPILLTTLRGLVHVYEHFGLPAAALVVARRGHEIARASSSDPSPLVFWEAHASWIQRTPGDRAVCDSLSDWMNRVTMQSDPRVLPDVARLAGACWTEAGDFERAASVYRDLIEHEERFPGDVGGRGESLQRGAWCANRIGDRDEAERLLRRFVADPHQSSAERTRMAAVLAVVLGADTDEGREALRKAGIEAPGRAAGLADARRWLATPP